VLAEFGTHLPDTVEVRVHDSTADLRYLVLPMRPSGTDKMNEEQLAALVSRDSMIGVSLPRQPCSMLSPAERRAKVRAVIRVASCNFIEAYDFIVYGYYANYIAATFFPTANEFASLMLSL